MTPYGFRMRTFPTQRKAIVNPCREHVRSLTAIFWMRGGGPYYRNLKESASHHFIWKLRVEHNTIRFKVPSFRPSLDDMENLQHPILHTISFCTPHTIVEIKISSHSREAFLIFWNAFDTFLAFSMPRESRLKKAVKKNTHKLVEGRNFPKGRNRGI